MNKNDKIFVSGHRGLVGSAIFRNLQDSGYQQLITRTSQELNLTDQAAVNDFFAKEKPDYVFLAAAKVGGIQANEIFPADFIRENLQIQTNVIDSAYRSGVKKLVFLGSSCIYPKFAPQPMPESCLLSGPLESSNEWYAIAKIAGVKMCQAYQKQYGFNAISLMPTNLYGPGDNFNLANSHVLPALIRKCHEAKKLGNNAVEVWGSGTPKREFLYVDDLVDASVFLMQQYDEPGIVNIGVGNDVSIRELAEIVKKIVGFEGELVFDATKPDGTPRKLMDVTRLNDLGWKAKIPLRTGIESTYAWFLRHQSGFRS